MEVRIPYVSCDMLSILMWWYARYSPNSTPRPPVITYNDTTSSRRPTEIFSKTKRAVYIITTSTVFGSLITIITIFIVELDRKKTKDNESRLL